MLAFLLLPIVANDVGAQAPADSGQTSLSPGDVIRIAVWRRPELSGDYIVGPDGTITHPLYHEIKVARVPLPEVESRVRTFLGRYESDPAFVVSPLLRVFVGGEVRLPGLYPLPPGTTISQALLSAGGMTDQAELQSVRLLRSGGERILDLANPGAAEAALPVHSGDQIVVTRHRSFFRDVLAPTSSVIAAGAALVSIVVTLRR
jgi:protein involved in polysaccharide export with SLBB domain